MTLAPRDLPRMLAPFLIGAYDIGVGLSRALYNYDDRVPAYAKAAHLMPIGAWGWSMFSVGVLIWLGIFDGRVAWLSMVIGLFMWTVWADLIFQALSDHRVSPSGFIGALGIALIHTLVGPYKRKQPVWYQQGWRRRFGRT